MKQYLTKAEVMEELHVKDTEYSKIINGIRENKGPNKRYGQYSIRGSGKILQVRYAVLTDYLANREFLGTAAEKTLPAFDVRAAERDLGVIAGDFQPAAVHIDEDSIADRITEKIFSRLAARLVGAG